jgi:hypothetical protein
MRKDRGKLPESTPPPDEPVTQKNVIPLPVGKKRVRKHVEPTAQEMKILTVQSLAAYSGLMKLRVLNQFVRTVLGGHGLQEYLLQVTKNRLHEAHRRPQRPGKPRKQPIWKQMTFAREWQDQLAKLVDRARRFIDEAEQTHETTRRGYFILRGESLKGKPVFITLHNRDNVVVGIYSGKQFNQKRANRCSRAESHRQAAAYRKSKSRLSPR